MGNFNRGRSGGGGGFRPRFNDRGPSRGPVEMHQATCDNCRKSCEVPFRPTSGKPIFCSSCFESQRGSESPRPSYRQEDRGNDRQMFDATCDECRNACKVPFQPSGDKPVYCSNCFGEKKGAVSNGNGQCQPQCKEQFAELSTKLDKILAILASTEEHVVITDEVKVAKKKSPKKKV